MAKEASMIGRADTAEETSAPSSAATDRADQLRASLAARQEVEVLLAEASEIRRAAAADADQLLEEAQSIAEQLVGDSQSTIDQLDDEARERSAGIVAQARAEAEVIMADAGTDADRQRTEASDEVDRLRLELQEEAAEQARVRLEALNRECDRILGEVESSLQGLRGSLTRSESAVADGLASLAVLHQVDLTELASAASPAVAAAPPQVEPDGLAEAAQLDEPADPGERSISEMFPEEPVSDPEPEPTLVVDDEAVTDSADEPDEDPNDEFDDEPAEGNGSRPLGWLFRSASS